MEPPVQRTKKDSEPEREMLRSLMIVSMRDMLTPGKTYASEKNRVAAIRWLNEESESPFSFNNTVTYLFNDSVDPESVRERVIKLSEDEEF